VITLEVDGVNEICAARRYLEIFARYAGRPYCRSTADHREPTNCRGLALKIGGEELLAMCAKVLEVATAILAAMNKNSSLESCMAISRRAEQLANLCPDRGKAMQDSGCKHPRRHQLVELPGARFHPGSSTRYAGFGTFRARFVLAISSMPTFSTS